MHANLATRVALSLHMLWIYIYVGASLLFWCTDKIRATYEYVLYNQWGRGRLGQGNSTTPSDTE